MACHHIMQDNKVVGHICFANIYEYKHNEKLFQFEWHYWSGPWPVNKDLELSKRNPGNKFWDMVDEFVKLSNEERKKYLIMS